MPFIVLHLDFAVYTLENVETRLYTKYLPAALAYRPPIRRHRAVGAHNYSKELFEMNVNTQHEELFLYRF